MLKGSDFLIVVLLIGSLSSLDATIIGNRLRFIFYPSNGIGTNYDANNLQTILTNPSFGMDKQTVFYFYGYTQSDITTDVQHIREAYNQNGRYNFILVDTDFLFYNFLVSKENYRRMKINKASYSMLDRLVKALPVQLLSFMMPAMQVQKLSL